MSVDPVVSNAGNPQSWNPYSYVRNNPLRHIDPTGMCIPDDDGPRGCGADPVSTDTCNLTCHEWKAAARAYTDAQASIDWTSQEPSPCNACAEWVAAADAYAWASTAAMGAGPSAGDSGGGGGGGWGLGDLYQSVGNEVKNGVSGVQNAISQGASNVGHVSEGVKQTAGDYCDHHDCTQLAITSAAIGITVAGIVTLQPELVYAGVTIYSLDVQYKWQQYQRGRESEKDVWKAVLGPVPGQAAGEKVGPWVDLALSGYDVARNSVTARGP